jgi:hypothetical protein
MLSFLKKTKPKPQDTEILCFKDNESAFQFALNTFGSVDDDSLVPEQLYFARLLEDYRGVDHNNDCVYIELPTENKTSLCFGVFPKNHSAVYPKGTLILFTPVHLTTIDMIESWLGVVNGVVEPTFNPKKGWKFKDRFIQN